MVSTTAPLDVTPMLRPERAALLELLRGLSADDWARPTECPAWNVKGIALHILGDDLSLLTRQRDESTNSLTLYAADHPGLTFRALLDGFNEEWVTAARFLSRELLIELLHLAGEWSESFYRDVGLETRSGEPVGFFAETEPSPYWQVIAREYVERVTHQSQIRRALGARELTGEPAVAAARVVVHVLAAWMRDYAPAVGTSIGVDLGDLGTWAWVRALDGWSVLEGGEPGGATATIAVRPTSAMAALTRGISSPDIDAILTISGDASLARGALEIVGPLLAPPG
jgi:uncharacterized protein (TIGR03083 family)